MASVPITSWKIKGEKPCRLTLAPRASVYVESDRGVKGTERSLHTGESTTRAQDDEFTDGWHRLVILMKETELFFFFFGWKELPSSKIHYLRGLWSGGLFTDEIRKLASSIPKMCPADPLLILFPPKSVSLSQKRPLGVVLLQYLTMNYGPRDCHAEGSKSDREKKIWYRLCVKSYKMVQMNLFTKQKQNHRCRQQTTVTKGERREG